MKDVPPTPADTAMLKRHTASSVKYNIQPHGLDHLKSAAKNLDRLAQYDKPKAQKLAKAASKKLKPVIGKINAHAGISGSLVSAQKIAK